SYDLPYIFHPDEPWPLRIGYQMLTTGDMNPHFFDWPTLSIYINYFVQASYSKLTGGVASNVSPVMQMGMGITYTPTPELVLISRLVSIAFGVGTVAIVIVAGKKIKQNTGVGLLAGLIMAVVPTGVELSRFITADVYATFFVSVVLLASVYIFKGGKTWAYILAGVALGLAVSSKYNTALIAMMILVAHFMRNGWKGFKDFRLYLIFLLEALGFLIGTPYAILSFREFLDGFLSVGQHYSSGHAGMEGNTLKFYLTYMWQTGGVIYILALLEVFRGFVTRNKMIILVSIFPVAYFIFICSFFVRNGRTFYPITPFALLLAASFLMFLWQKTKEVKRRPLRFALLIGTVLLALGSIVFPIVKTVQATLKLTEVSSRETSRVWINENLPSGTKIAFESYAPFIDPEVYSLVRVDKMIDYEAEWYLENGIEYLVFCNGMYGRYYWEPDRYALEVEQYEVLFDRFTLVNQFNDSIYEVRIYKVE
ncbi:MAG: glycosyltransferase family 39 protein, partial [Anaerolineaceae bacterium]|nr:glycosyltransferase family 39 protein [Anaerolineaceae bacterium]